MRREYVTAAVAIPLLIGGLALAGYLNRGGLLEETSPGVQIPVTTLEGKFTVTVRDARTGAPAYGTVCVRPRFPFAESRCESLHGGITVFWEELKEGESVEFEIVYVPANVMKYEATCGSGRLEVIVVDSLPPHIFCNGSALEWSLVWERTWLSASSNATVIGEFSSEKRDFVCDGCSITAEPVPLQTNFGG